MNKYTQYIRIIIGLIFPIGLFSVFFQGASKTGEYGFLIEIFVIWMLLFSVMPISIIRQKRKMNHFAKIDIMLLLYNTVGTFYLFTCLGLALFAALLLDALAKNTPSLTSITFESSIVPFCIVLIVASVLALIFYTKRFRKNVKYLKATGVKVMVDATVKVDLYFLISRPFQRFYNVYAETINPFTGKKIKLKGRAIGVQGREIPKTFPVYFDSQNPKNYYFDTNSWQEGEYC